MSKRSLKEVQDHVEAHGGKLVRLSGTNFNIRKGMKSANIGRPKNGSKWDDAQLLPAWKETGIPKLE